MASHGRSRARDEMNDSHLSEMLNTWGGWGRESVSQGGCSSQEVPGHPGNFGAVGATLFGDWAAAQQSTLPTAAGACWLVVFLANVNSCLCSLFVVVRPSVCLSSVTFVHPTQAIEISGNVYTNLTSLLLTNISVNDKFWPIATLIETETYSSVYAPLQSSQTSW